MALRLWTRVQRSLFRRAQDDRDLEDELRFHLAQEIQLRVDRGATPADAERTARVALGSLTRTREDTRAVWVSTRLEQLLQDLRAGSRIVTKSPGLTLAAVVLIALVIGGNTTIFSIVHAILNKPAPGVAAEDLVTLTWMEPPDWIEPEIDYATYSDLRAQTRSVRLVGSFADRITLSDHDSSHAVWGAGVTPDYFDVLGARMALGRTMSADDYGDAASGLVAIVSHVAWQTYFHGDPAVVGMSVLINGRPATVVGVAAPPFRGSMLVPPVDVWLPFTTLMRALGRDRMLIDRQARGPILVGQLSDGQSRDTARAELSAVWTRLKRAYPELPQNREVAVLPYSGMAGGNSAIQTYGGSFLAIFSVITAMTLLIVCANVANLLIGRALTRQREMALRQSLGASRGRVVRLLLAEGVSIAALAWIAACVMAWWVSKALIAFVGPTEVMTDFDPRPDWTVAVYALALAAAALIAFTVAPALRAWRQPLLPWLKSGEQGIVQGRSRLSTALVVVQLSFSVLLLVAAGLAYRSVSLLGGVDLGYDTRGLLLAGVRTVAAQDDRERTAALLERIRERLAALPGIEAVSYARSAPREFWPSEAVRADGATEPVLAEVNQVGADYLASFGLVPRAGQDLPPPAERAVRPAVITESLAASLWPGQSALGRTLEFDRRRQTVTVVGVAPDAFFGGYRTTTRPRIVLVSSADVAGEIGGATFHIRHTQPLDATVAAIHREIRNIDPRVPVVSMQTLEARLAAILWPVRMVTTLLALFGCGSLLIAAIGQYAAVSFDMRRRVREVGVRMALGASSRQVLASVLRDGFRSTGVGLGIGFLLSVALAVALSGVLYGVTPTDAMTYGAVFALLTTASLIACVLPARRAARVDPIRALRYE